MNVKDTDTKKNETVEKIDLKKYLKNIEFADEFKLDLTN